jgi:hypothetical protein
MEGQRLRSPSALEAGTGLGAPLLDKPRAARVQVGVHGKRTGLLPLVLAALLATCCVRLALDVGMTSRLSPGGAAVLPWRTPALGQASSAPFAGLPSDATEEDAPVIGFDPYAGRALEPVAVGVAAAADEAVREPDASDEPGDVPATVLSSEPGGVAATALSSEAPSGTPRAVAVAVFKIEADWFDPNVDKMRRRKDYTGTLAAAFQAGGLVDSRLVDSHRKDRPLAPGAVSEGVSLVWGVHWENVFTEAGEALPLHHRRRLAELEAKWRAERSGDALAGPARAPGTLGDAFAGLGAGVAVNMLPGVVRNLCSKSGLVAAERHARAAFGDQWSEHVFLPSTTLASRAEQEAFVRQCSGGEAASSGAPALWALKPGNAAEGAGIRVLSCDSVVDNGEWQRTLRHARGAGGWVAQRYVAQPVLTQSGRKFDLRAWLLVASLDPLRLFVVRDAHVRVASEPYDPAPAYLKHACMHLTNGKVQKECRKHRPRRVDVEAAEEGRAPEHARDEGEVGSLRSDSFRRLVLGAGADEDAVARLWAGVEALMVRTVLAVRPRLREAARAQQMRARGFQLLAFDVILDAQRGGRPALLEVNPDGYLSKGFLRVSGGFECLRDLAAGVAAGGAGGRAADATPSEALEAERACRNGEQLRLAGLRRAGGVVPAEPPAVAIECHRAVAEHLVALRSFHGSCWRAAFPTRGTLGDAAAQPPWQSDKDLALASWLALQPDASKGGGGTG